MKIDAKAKRFIKKNSIHNCAYIYTDGIVVVGRDSHYYKGKKFENDVVFKFVGEIPIHIHNNNGEGPFVGRIVLHNPSLLLDGIQGVRIYRNNQSEKMKDMGINCDSITLITDKGMHIRSDIFYFISNDFTIQNNSKESVTAWDC